jgi:mono/diheme cytochrome c family protein
MSMAMFRLRFAFAGLILTAAFGVCLRGAAQQTIRESPRLAIDSLYGPDVFAFYCAPCHGRDGKGDGPVAAALKSRVPDLTQIARRNGGIFPKVRIENYVTNRSVDPIPAHGSGEMPVWGPIFQSLDPSDARVKVRIANVVAYLESIQMK